ncbi:MAG: hypothetical protein V3V05_09685 [Pontiella sp.]
MEADDGLNDFPPSHSAGKRPLRRNPIEGRKSKFLGINPDNNMNRFIGKHLPRLMAVVRYGSQSVKISLSGGKAEQLDGSLKSFKN